MHPTELDRERFRDLTKAIVAGLEYNRCPDGEYREATTQIAWRIWWSVERERQLLQNLNQSQGVKLSELLARAEKAEEALRSLASFVGAGGYNADKVDAGVFEQKIHWGIGQIMERLEKAEAELESLRWQKPVATLVLSYDGADFEMYYDNNKLRFEGMSMKLYAAAGAAPAALEMLRDILNTADAKRIFDKLSFGQGIGTDDGRTWLSARAMLQSTPQAPTVPDGRVSQDESTLTMAASALALFRAGESAEYMAKAIEALLQSAPQSGSEPVAHHPV
jgi:hypothetical protein